MIVARPHLPMAGDVVHQARRGSPAALGSIYEAHAAGLHRLAWRITGSADDAEDVLHDLFVGLPELLRRYDERGQLGAWLRRVMVRLALARLRRERRREGIAAVAPELHLQAGSGTSAEGLDLARAIAALPHTLRSVFVLRQLEGYAHEEIGELLGITSGASRVRYLRALRRLRNSLDRS